MDRNSVLSLINHRMPIPVSPLEIAPHHVAASHHRMILKGRGARGKTVPCLQGHYFFVIYLEISPKVQLVLVEGISTAEKGHKAHENRLMEGSFGWLKNIVPGIIIDKK